jgi:hypothetical protein
MPVPYSEFVWGGRLYNPEINKGGHYQHAPLFHGEGGRDGQDQYAFYPRAWKAGAKRIELSIPRTGASIVDQIRDDSALTIYRLITEAALQGNRRGIGRVGGDFWPLPTGKESKFQPLCTDHGGCSMTTTILAMTSPGPDGAVFNERLEMFREGVQVAEAIIAVQRSLDGKRIGGELAERAERLLDERARYYLRACLPYVANRLSFECSNWQERDSRLFALAAEISRATR